MKKHDYERKDNRMIAAIKFFLRKLHWILLFAIIFAIGAYFTGKYDEFRDFFFPETAAYTRSTLTIINSIQAMGQLVTVKNEVETTDLLIDIKRGLFNLGGYSANHIAVGAIEAGIDFDAIDEDSLRFENDTYFITLPAAIITSCRIEYIDQNRYSLTLLPADWDLVRQIAHAEALAQFVPEMLENGILERAEEEAALRIGNFARAITGKQAHVEFAAHTGELELPESCQPIAPSGWYKDESSAWKKK